jgi:hypothetical protein
MSETIALPLQRTTLAAAYHAGDTTLTLAVGGAAVAPSPSGGSPAYVAVIDPATFGTQQPRMIVLSATGRSGDVLSGVSLADGSDQYFAIGSLVYEAENPSSGAGVGTVTSVATGTGLTGGTITGSGTISLATVSDQRVLANVSGSTAAPVPNTLSDTIDACIASVQGDILYRGASAWAALTPGTSGQFLETQGAAANPTWASLPIATGSVLGVVKIGSGLSVTGGGLLTATGGTGTVTSVTLGNANGVTLSGTNPITTSGTITVGLGNITPTSVAASGTVTGSNLSGTNTGDQTITLTGDVTGSGTGSFVTTIANGAIDTATLGDGSVTFPKIANMSAHTLLGNPTGSSASPEEITLGTGLTFSGTTLNATGTGGTVTSITAGSGLSGGTITTSGTIALSTIGNNSVLANISGSSSVPTSIAATALMDSAFGLAQGSVLYRGSSSWAALGPGTDGQVLTTHGAASNPTWVDAGAGTVTSIATGTGLTGGTITTSGTISLASIANHTVLANTSGGSAAPVSTTVTALIDDAISSTQGVILYRGASSWSTLAPGTSGQVLATQGASANPQWITAGGTVTNIATGTGLTGGPITGTGTISLASIANHTLLANTSGGSAAPVSTTLTALIDDAIASTHGDVLYRSATDWAALAPGTAGQVLTTQGASANPNWTSAGMTAIANDRVLANVSGSSGLPTANTLSDVIDNCIASTQGDVLYRNASGWVALAPGTSGQFLSTGGAAANPSWASGTGGTVTSLTAGTGITLTPSTITSTGSIALTVPVTAVNGGTGQISYVLGDLLYASNSTTLGKLSGNTTTTKEFLSSTGNGSLAAAPAWTALGQSDIAGLSPGVHSFGVSGTPNLNDVTPPIFTDRALTCDGLTAAAGTAPSGGSVTFTLQTSTDGVSWSNLSSGAVSITTGNYSGTAACTTAISANTFIRAQFTAVNSGANATVMLFFRS